MCYHYVLKKERFSFQLAIIVPRINLIGYDTATAQTWRRGLEIVTLFWL